MSNLSKLAMALGMKFGPVRKGLTPRRILEHVLNDMVMVQADASTTKDVLMSARYSGMVEAYRSVAHHIAPFSDVPPKVPGVRGLK